mmetsp:Transcript_27553/g.42739  ORF Transcript_27553/g.42739 Transcript_27553/m.42739 type:complete len:1224 (-) Transcript_27553:110-3781(-)|eukprot:CAMPEP_0196810414 /NCGR_PEP_ID=MMETSP1362-20130617/10237_1 /TAXON_ID=163516 /ORGANISM="Leptocylindrus danicus, Strain CCMP1856" /LENGTH=1223 /DNA_ID=CAMNT_0042185399 /DNA_START=29 /DNA_END=3700 /DNA_ORIENTATION=-
MAGKVDSVLATTTAGADAEAQAQAQACSSSEEESKSEDMDGLHEPKLLEETKRKEYWLGRLSNRIDAGSKNSDDDSSSSSQDKRRAGTGRRMTSIDTHGSCNESTGTRGNTISTAPSMTSALDVDKWLVKGANKQKYTRDTSDIGQQCFNNLYYAGLESELHRLCQEAFLAATYDGFVKPAQWSAIVDYIEEQYPAQLKADLRRREGEYSWTPLHIVSSFAPVDIIEMMLDSKAASLPNKTGKLPLHNAVEENNDIAAIEAIMNVYPYAVITKNNRGFTPLHTAFRMKYAAENFETTKCALHISKVVSLLSNSSARASNLWSELHRDELKIGLLLSDEVYYNGVESKLHQLCQEAYWMAREWSDVAQYALSISDEMIRQEISRCEGEYNSTALMIATKSAPFFVVKLMLQKAPEAAHIPDGNGNLPLHLAIDAYRDFNIISAIVDVYPEALVSENGNGFTPVHSAWRKGFGERTLKKLRGKARNMALKVWEDEIYSDPMKIGLLLKDEMDYEGMMGNLHRLFQEAYLSIEDSSTLVDDYGRSWEDVFRYLRKRSPEKLKAAVLRKEGKHKSTALHIASWSAPVSVINILLEAAPEASLEPDKYGELPLHIAIKQNEHTEVTKALLRAYTEGSTVENKNRMSPLALAMNDANKTTVAAIKFFHCLEAAISLPGQIIWENASRPEWCASIVRFSFLLPKHFTEDRSIASKCAHQMITYYNDDCGHLQRLPLYIREGVVLLRRVQKTMNSRISLPFHTAVIFLDFTFILATLICFRAASNDVIRGKDIELQDICFLYVAVGYFFMRETVQIVSMVKSDQWLRYIGLWNMVDVWIIFVLATSTVWMQGLDSKEPLEVDSGARLLFVIMTASLWLKVFSFLKSIVQPMAIFMNGLLQVLKNLAPLTISLCIILVAFAQMFRSSFDSTDGCFDVDVDEVAHDFCTSVPKSYFRIYEMMNDYNDQTFQHESNKIAFWMYIVYNILVVIVLLNGVLIALVSDSYGEVRNKANRVFWLERLALVSELDLLFELFCSVWYWITGTYIAGGGMKDGPATVNQYAFFHRNFGEGFWSVLLLSYENTHFNEQKRDFIQDKYYVSDWSNLKWLAGRPRQWRPNKNSLIDTDERRNLLRLRVVGIIIIPVWFVLGIFSMGLLWPPQVRKYIMSGRTSDFKGQNDKLDAVASNDGDPINLAKIKTKQQSMETELSEVKSQLDKLNGNVLKILALLEKPV